MCSVFLPNDTNFGDLARVSKGFFSLSKEAFWEKLRFVNVEKGITILLQICMYVEEIAKDKRKCEFYLNNLEKYFFNHPDFQCRSVALTAAILLHKSSVGIKKDTIEQLMRYFATSLRFVFKQRPTFATCLLALIKENQQNSVPSKLFDEATIKAVEKSLTYAQGVYKKFYLHCFQLMMDWSCPGSKDDRLFQVLIGESFSTQYQKELNEIIACLGFEDVIKKILSFYETDTIWALDGFHFIKGNLSSDQLDQFIPRLLDGFECQPVRVVTMIKSVWDKFYLSAKKSIFQGVLDRNFSDDSLNAIGKIISKVLELPEIQSQLILNGITQLEERLKEARYSSSSEKNTRVILGTYFCIWPLLSEEQIDQFLEKVIGYFETCFLEPYCRLDNNFDLFLSNAIPILSPVQIERVFLKLITAIRNNKDCRLSMLAFTFLRSVLSYRDNEPKMFERMLIEAINVYEDSHIYHPKQLKSVVDILSESAKTSSEHMTYLYQKITTLIEDETSQNNWQGLILLRAAFLHLLPEQRETLIDKISDKLIDKTLSIHQEEAFNIFGMLDNDQLAKLLERIDNKESKIEEVDESTRSFFKAW